MPTPAFLPAELDNLGAWIDLINSSYAVFKTDLLGAPPTVDGGVVEVAKQLGPDNKEIGYWHLVTREAVRGSPRVPDPDRARRLPWIKPLIENRNDIAVTYFTYLESDGYHRHYFWLRQEQYVVIVQQKRTKMFLVTSFNVDIPWKQLDLEKRFRRRTV